MERGRDRRGIVLPGRDRGQRGDGRGRVGGAWKQGRAHSQPAFIQSQRGLGLNLKMTQTIYESIGGERTVRALVDRFYDLMDTLPEAAGIRALHPETLDHSREKLFMFLTGWMGGPP